MTIPIIWRGFGLMVPIVFGICAWIVSYWYDDTTLGNPSYMGWSLFYTSIVLLLPGLALFADKDEEDGRKRYHDFFFVPILFWSLGLGGLCTYVLLSREAPSGNGNTTVQADEEDVDYEAVFRTVNFVNSSTDSMELVIRTDKGEVARFFVEPKTWKPRDLKANTYTFTSYDLEGNKIAQLKDQKITEPEDPKAAKIYHEQWMQMDGGEHNLMLIEVTPVLPQDFTRGDLDSVDWTKQIVDVYKPSTLMTPVYPKDAGYNPKMLVPGDYIPSYTPDGQRVFSLINVPVDQELTNEYLVERLGKIYFEQ